MYEGGDPEPSSKDSIQKLRAIPGDWVNMIDQDLFWESASVER